jgi:voltage-gated potassium channel
MAAFASREDASYLVFSLTLSIFALVLLAINTLSTLDPRTSEILDYFDNGVCLLFFIDFLLTWWRAEHKLSYMLKWGWLDLLSSLPMVDPLRWGRLARVFQILRVLRGLRSVKILTEFILSRRSESAFLAVALVSLLLVMVSAIGILQLENTSEANIKTAEDALWWSVVTITTVGYGDRFPVTTEGRLLATLLMIAGVGLFGTFSGFVASWFLKPAEEKRVGELEVLQQEMHALREQLATLQGVGQDRHV